MYHRGVHVPHVTRKQPLNVMMFFHFFIWYLVFPPYPAYQRRKINEGSEKQTGKFGTDDNGNNIHRIFFSFYVRPFADSEFISSLVVLADAVFDYVVPALQTKPILCGGVLVPHSPQSEKANLISDWWKVRQYVTVQMLHKAITLINEVYTVGPDISNISENMCRLLFIAMLVWLLVFYSV